MNLVKQFFLVELTNEVLQSYKDPDTPVDLILLANMMNYIAESAEYQVTRCLQWLKPGGHLLIVGRKWTHMDTVSSMNLQFSCFPTYYYFLYDWVLIYFSLFTSPFTVKYLNFR